MDKTNNKDVGWIIALLEKWPSNKDSFAGRYKLYRFFEKHNFLKMASNIYVRAISKEEFEEWKFRIKFTLPKDGSVNAIYLTSEQWDAMKITASLDKFKKKS